jgi:phosphatidylethanolamine/phosphatidyl-N-methylethanolamine N-methyltransferase
LIATYFDKSRIKSIDSLKIFPGAKVLIVGAGTGLDLIHLPDDCEIVATDITPAMVNKIKSRNVKLKKMATLYVMDGHELLFESESFDFVILHLILAVIPDPNKCLQEVERVLKPEGTIAVFDKFVKQEATISWGRRLVNLFTNLFFSDVTRKIETIVDSTKLIIVNNEGADFKGNFRRIILKKDD